MIESRVLRHSALAMALCWLAAASAAEPDAMDKWRARVDEARVRAYLPPPAGVRDLQWKELSPPGWSATKLLQQLGIDKLHDNDPRALAIQDQMRRQWDQAPTVTAPDDALVRLSGYPMLLEDSDRPPTSIIMAPYPAAGVQRPVPPANQMVLVQLKYALPADMQKRPIWIIGKIVALATPTRHGRVAYLMLNATWKPYPIYKYPMPQYALPR